MLAGISPEWYTRLEQGRDINVSVQLLESLARVLQLNENERTYLFLIALRQPPPVEMFSPPVISPTLQQFLNQLGTIPGCILDIRLNIVAWNKAHCAVFGDYGGMAERERNLVWRIFTSPLPPIINDDWEGLARACLAQFRAGYGRFIKDPWWANRIAELNEASPKFRELWARRDVLNMSEGHKLMHHPVAGDLDFDFLWFQAVDSSDLRIMIHTPRANTGTIEKIERLLACKSE